MLVLVTCYNRFHNLTYWYKAWQAMDTKDCKLIFAITGPFVDNAFDPAIAEVIALPNTGGVLRKFFQERYDYDRILFCPDDFLPVKKEVLQLCTTADMVGTFWSAPMVVPSSQFHASEGVFILNEFQKEPTASVIRIPGHIRSGGIAITDKIAKSVKFPPLVDNNLKLQEYRFEFLDYNFYEQVREMGCSVKMMDGSVPPDSLHWSSVNQEYICDTDNSYCEFSGW